MAERGPVEGEPRYVTSFASFLRQFGGYLSEFAYGEYRYLAGSVEQFFANGGTKCFVSRVIAPGAKSAAVSAGILKAEAKNEGTWGNRIQIKIAYKEAGGRQLSGKKYKRFYGGRFLGQEKQRVF